VPVQVKGRSKDKVTITVPPAVMEQERLKERQSRGRKETFPIFAGIVLNKQRAEKLEEGESLDVTVDVG
jgi:hypothetical protein